ncbi:hypothetical protein FCM35_KLT02019 [Carex littledalei]|uniref:Uncharacterized protein n=1 Tax=Carex littledalei TaxID=544730 RepID=A0A833VBI4_9POAL|nr:hypothetical protein FCM35_KLT02019 [Carex littledalei]
MNSDADRRAPLSAPQAPSGFFSLPSSFPERSFFSTLSVPSSLPSLKFSRILSNGGHLILPTNPQLPPLLHQFSSHFAPLATDESALESRSQSSVSSYFRDVK